MPLPQFPWPGQSVPPISMPAPTSPGKCNVGLECNRIAGSGYHCGIAMSYYDSAGRVVRDRLHSLGSFHQGGVAFGCHIAVNPPNIIAEAFEILDVTEHPMAVCNCLRSTAATLNTGIGTNNYRVFPTHDDTCGKRTECNSNYSAKCLLRHCGLSKPQPESPPGEGHRMWRCAASVDATGPPICICCECLKWVAIDTGWCGPAENPPPKVICRQALVNPRTHP
jgi:hypothetical protein